MINQLPRNILSFFLLVLIQVMILNNIQISNLGIYSFLYVLFILILPFETPSWLLLISAFLLGISIDIFSDTTGLHAASTVFMAFLRPYLLRITAPREGYEAGSQPTVYSYGFEWFLRYSLPLIFAHHIMFFYLDAFDFSDFFRTLFRTLLSIVFTTVTIVLTQFFVSKK